MRRLLPVLFLLFAAPLAAHEDEERVDADTAILVDKVQVTAIKQGLVLRTQPVAATILGSRAIEREHVDAVKNLSQRVPNLHIPDYGSRMTSSIYIRGLGARIDQPVMGMNVDNVPIMNKDCYDTELFDVERIEILRGPQSTLYGRNTMGGVINVYTLSPLSYQGVRLMAEYGSGNTCRVRAGFYALPKPGLGVAVSGFYDRSDGFFENLATGRLCDGEQSGGGRFKLQWRNGKGLRIDNTFAFSHLDQDGYPYAYAGEELVHDGQTIIRPGEIRYNDPSGYRRTTLSDGLTIRYDTERYSVSSITAYQYSDDAMTLDQDFLPLSYFTLRQARTEHTVSEDLVFRSLDEGTYRWIVGAFGFYRRSEMDAPVLFKRDGIDDLILANANAHDPEYRYEWPDDELLLGSRFRQPVAGAALYHESDWEAGRWRFTAGLRIDFEHAWLRYANTADTRYEAIRRTDGEVYSTPLKIDESGTLRRSFVEVLPKAAVLYRFGNNCTLYASVSKGYKAGGFNTQMFSEVLQQKLMNRMGFGTLYEVSDIVTYRPEKSWNYEIGSRLSDRSGMWHADVALFAIDCRNQQLTVFPEGTTTGRMMTNAGRTRSLGAELSVTGNIARKIDLEAAYGFTDARFVRFDDGRNDYAGNRIPYAPRHTLSASVSWSIPTRMRWLEQIVLHAGVRGAGRIWWDEENTLSQPFYALCDASVRFEHRRFTLDLWGRNLSGARYDIFRFASIGHSFLQQGRPRTFGVTLHVNINR
ncbi:MAG: TonB-dependent receptor [Alistipes sp.]|nr:TonB-dependent receptor [Alistipes senegalensis]MCM1250922.1 TonB-dependent receptor [Alistipes sp.]